MKKKIIVIDDDPELATDVRAAFLRWGLEYTVVSNTELRMPDSKEEGAINDFCDRIVSFVRAEQSDTEAILLDIMFEQGEGASGEAHPLGHKLGKALRLNFPVLPIIFFTIRGKSEEILDDSLSFNFDNYISKSEFKSWRSHHQFRAVLHGAQQKRDGALQELTEILREHKGLNLPNELKEAIDYILSCSNERIDTTVDLLIVAATEDELEIFWELPYRWEKPNQIDGSIVTRVGTLGNGHRLMASSPREMGMVPMSLHAARLFTKYCPRIAVLVGTCGGMKKNNVGLGDIVVPKLCYHYQFGKVENNVLARELRSENPDELLLSQAETLAKEKGILSGINSDIPVSVTKPDSVLRCHFGPMACSDLIVKDKAKLAEAITAERKVVAVEMESYAFLYVARKLKQRAFVCKSVTDFADAKKDDKFRGYAFETYSRFINKLFEVVFSAPGDVN